MTKLERLLSMVRPPGDGSFKVPLKINDEAVEIIEGLPAFCLEFADVSCEATQSFDNSRSKQVIDPEDGTLALQITHWSGLVSLLRNKMLVGGFLPKMEVLGTLDAFDLGDLPGETQKIAMCKKYLKMPLVQAIVSQATEFYGVTSEVNDDLKN